MNTNISTDVEYSWESDTRRWQWSLLSLWSCIVGDINTSFYAEIQPINGIYNERAMQTIAPWFVTLWDITWLNWEEILNLLREKGEHPREFIERYSAWLNEKWQVSEIASPIKFDGGLTGYYFRRYAKSNPFWFSGSDGKSMLQGFFSDTRVSFKKLLWEQELPHNALKDSQIQAVEFELLLRMMKDTKSWADYQARYHKSLDNFRASSEIQNLLTWTRDTISSIRRTPFSSPITTYSSIL